MRFEATAGRIWKKLPREERRLAANAFCKEPAPELLGAALAAIVRARHVRPQVARGMSATEQAATLAAVLDPGEPLAGSLLVALHLGERRPMLGAFLEALGLPHEDGVLKDDAALPPLDAAKLEAAVRSLRESFPREQLALYFNVLLLQDPERWGAIEAAEAWLAP